MLVSVRHLFIPSPANIARWLTFFLLAFLALWFLRVYNVTTAFGTGNTRYGPEAMFYGTGFKPYAYRFVPSSLTKFLYNLTPGVVMDWTAGYFKSLGIPGENTSQLYLRGLVCGMTYAAVGIYLWLLCAAARRLFPGTLYGGALAGTLSLFMLPINALLPYDFFTLTLVAALIYSLAAQRKRLFIALFALASLHKESALLFVPLFLYAGLRRGARKGELIGDAQLLLLIFFLIRGVMLLFFQNNPGAYFTLTMPVHLAHGLYGYNELRLFEFLGLLFFLVYGWAHKPPLLRFALYLAIPYALAYFFLADLGEMRFWLEFNPIIALLLAHTLLSCAQAQPLQEEVRRRSSVVGREEGDRRPTTNDRPFT